MPPKLLPIDVYWESRPLQPTYEQLATSHFASKLTINPIQQLHLELDKGSEGDYRRTLYLIREIVKQRGLPPNLSMRLLKFCVHEDIEYLAREVLSRQVVFVNSREGGELLWTAVKAGRHEVAALLIGRNADLSVRMLDRTVLHAVVRSKKIRAKREELVRMMLERGVDVDARDAKGRSALNQAIVYKHCSSELVELLLKHGARVSVDDIYAAARCKSEVLPRLVDDPVVEARNLKGAMAIEYLISKQGAAVDVARLIKRILELSVPVDGDDPFVEKRLGKRPCSLLSLALFYQEKAVIKLLLDHGANPHRKNEFGHTPLFQATAFRNYTHASRWLIEKGANLHDRNDDGSYLIHGACETKSVKNVHLLLNLGADLNVTDHEGRTPFCYTDDTTYFNATHALLVKHFALTIARGGKISVADMAKINKHVWIEHHFKKCTMQLRRMKAETIYDDVTYFALLSRDMYGKMQLMKNPNFAMKFKQNEKKRADLFPQYSYMLLHSFEITDMRYQMFQAEKKPIAKIFGRAVPDGVIEKITYYLNVEKLRRRQYDYYMAFHASLKNTKVDKRKIM